MINSILLYIKIIIKIAKNLFNIDCELLLVMINILKD